MRIAAHGLALDAPVGWDARIRKYDQQAVATMAAHQLAPDDPSSLDARMRRPHATEAKTSANAEFRVHPVLHAADFALPEERGDFGSGVVEIMQPDQAFIALLEYHPDNAKTALFLSNAGMPRQIDIDAFSPRQLQRTIRGQGGTQFFFVDGGRAFCLYMVLGSMANGGRAIPRLNAALSAIEIHPTAPKRVD